MDGWILKHIINIRISLDYLKITGLIFLNKKNPFRTYAGESSDDKTKQQQVLSSFAHYEIYLMCQTGKGARDYYGYTFTKNRPFEKKPCDRLQFLPLNSSMTGSEKKYNS